MNSNRKSARFPEIQNLALQVIRSFPKSKNGQPFLSLKNGRKLFFSIFVKKYGLDGNNCSYQEEDIIRRVRLVEFFDYFVKDFDIVKKEINERGKQVFILESHFHRMIIIDTGNKESKLELLSFYPYK